MKKQIKVLVLAAGLAALAVPAFAQWQFLAAPRLDWIIGAATSPKDTVSIVGMTTTTAASAVTDTTEWFDVAGYRFAPAGFTASPLVQIAITTTVAADSIGYVIQYRSDQDQAKFSSTSQAYVVGNLSNVVDVLTSAGASNGRFFRVILWANDTGGVVHTYTITPLVRGWR